MNPHDRELADRYIPDQGPDRVSRRAGTCSDSCKALGMTI